MEVLVSIFWKNPFHFETFSQKMDTVPKQFGNGRRISTVIVAPIVMGDDSVIFRDLLAVVRGWQC